MKSRPDMLDERSPRGIEVFQLTDWPERGSHVYMEAQVFTPDSTRLLLHRAAHPHGPEKAHLAHAYFACEPATGELAQLTDELGTVAPSVSPDGRWLYYIVDETALGGTRVSLRRVGLDGSSRETLDVLDGTVPGADFAPSRIYPLSTIRSDGRKLAIAALGTKDFASPRWGLIVFDLVECSAELVLEGPSWCNLHPQYCRSRKPSELRDIMVQENHGSVWSLDGKCEKLTTGAGADIHLIRDDGSRMRSFPWGRDGDEHAQGHQCWRGRSAWAITSTGVRSTGAAELIESKAVAFPGEHAGLAVPGGRRNVLSRSHPRPRFYHFQTDEPGGQLITDYRPEGEGTMELFLARLGRPGRSAARGWTRLLDTRSTGLKDNHVHPFLSPDGRWAFFNSDESGTLQAYAVKGLEAAPDNGACLSSEKR